AAGRNGGWCSLHHAGVTGWLRSPQRAGAIALQRAMFDAVDEVGRVAAAEGIACDYAKAGLLNFVTSAPEEARVRAMLAAIREHGFGDDDLRWLDAKACAERVRIAGGCARASSCCAPRATRSTSTASGGCSRCTR